jgi:chemotaxis protein CheZ
MPEGAPDGAHSSQAKAPRKLSLAEEYAALEALLSASSRGRWFLAEFVRRNRTAETDMLLEAITKLEVAVLKPQRQVVAPNNVLAELVEMSEAISRTRREIAQIKPPYQFDKQLTTATEELDRIVEATEKATSEILGAAEEIQEVAWTLREKGTGIELCDRIDQRTTDIYTACSFQDITGQRTGKVVHGLRFIEQRINAMIEIWGVDDIAFKVDDMAAKMEAQAAAQADEHFLQGPQRRGEGLKQADVDRMLRARDEKTRARGFERPEPLTLAELHAVKCAALFG